MDKKNYITFQDGIKLNGPKAFNALTKPVGSVCNLACKYCYYIDKERFYGKHQPRMSDEMLENYIKEYIQTNEIPEITFCWHGGEPTLAGIDFFRKAVAFERKYNTNNKKIINSIQTNGTLITDEWANFFRKNRFLVGISIDGPEDIYNSYRVNKSGKGMYKSVMKGLEILKRHHVDFNILCVVTNKSAGRGKEIYNFFKEQGAQFLQFLPCVDYLKKNERYPDRAVIVDPIKINAGEAEDPNSGIYPSPYNTTAEDYGQFLIDIFDEWVINDVGKIFVQLFDLTLSSWCGIPPSVCAYREICGDVLAVEHNGDVFSCDHFVYPEHKLGNIQTSSISEMLRSQQQIDFGINKRNTLSRECMRCEYYFACRGECPKHRHIDTIDGEKKFSLCEGLKAFYKHVDPYMSFMRDMLSQEKAPALVMEWARAAKGML